MKTILKMENVKKSFGSGHNEIQALKGIDLAVNQGNLFQLLVHPVQEKVHFSQLQVVYKVRLLGIFQSMA